MEELDYSAARDFSDADAQLLGQIFARMAAEGRLSPTSVVQEAERPNSPLRRFFEWDNLRAAHNYRLDRARLLIRSIVIPSRGRDELGVVRAFVSIPARKDPANINVRSTPSASVEGQEQVWVSRETAKSEEWMREHLRRKALRQAMAWEAEYADWAEDDMTFQPVVEGIRETGRRFEKEREDVAAPVAA